MKNNKGLIFSTYVYILLIFFLLLLGTMLVVLNNTKMLSEKIKVSESENSGSENSDFNIVLNGEGVVTIFRGLTFTDPGYTAQTKSGESLTATVKSTVDTSEVGNYKVTYTVKYGRNTKKVTRTVKVVNAINYGYVGTVQTFTAPVTGWYQIEAWGASGNNNYNAYVLLNPAYGGYTSGKINLNAGEKLYIYVGGEKKTFNCCTQQGVRAGSGGATDIRYFQTTPEDSQLLWNDAIGLNSRIMVAGGAGGSYSDASAPGGGSGGGLISENIVHASHGLSGATQISGGSASLNGTVGTFGMAGINSTQNYNSGGGGYYGGGSGPEGGGGSSYISGYAGVVSIDNCTTETCTNPRAHTNNNTRHYSGKYFIDGEMQVGVNNGNGKAKITYIGSTKPERKNTTLNGVQYVKDCVTGNATNGLGYWAEVQAIKDGLNIAKGIEPIGTATAYNSSYSYTFATDGDTDSGLHHAATLTNVQGSSECIIINLGAEYNLDEIAVWHLDNQNWPSYQPITGNVLFVAGANQIYRTVINYEDTEEDVNGNRVNPYQNIKTFAYTGAVQTFTASQAGTYKIELWGARGGTLDIPKIYGGLGGYTSGNIYLNQNDKLYVYVGQSGQIGRKASEPTIPYNGGGNVEVSYYNNSYAFNGGGATDIRYFGESTPSSSDLLWNSPLGLKSRIMVAGAGGGSSWETSNDNTSAIAAGGAGGGLAGKNGVEGCYTGYCGQTTVSGYGGTQNASNVVNGGFGFGGTAPTNRTTGGAGGGGYYGGGAGYGGYANGYSGGGGSSYISGYTGCVAVTSAGTPKTGCDTYTTDNSCSIHYSGKKFTNMEMKSGNQMMPTHNGNSTMVGNSGNGFAKITYIGT